MWNVSVSQAALCSNVSQLLHARKQQERLGRGEAPLHRTPWQRDVFSAASPDEEPVEDVEASANEDQEVSRRDKRGRALG